MSNTISSISENIRSVRIQKGITQKELAKRIKKSYSSVQKYEMGIAVPPLSVVEKIAEALGVDKFEIIGWNAFELKEEKSPEPEGSEDEKIQMVVSGLTGLLERAGWIAPGGDLTDAQLRTLASYVIGLSAYFDSETEG